MKKYFAILLIVLIGLLVSLSLSGCHKSVPVTSQETAENKTVWMPDRNLRQAVREALKLAPGASLTPQALAGLTKLELVTFSTPYKQKISSLKGLEHATGLEVLRLYKHQVKDIILLTDLAKLEWLVLYDNEIRDITPLASLTGLKKLDLDSNKIKDITPLLRLTGLEELDLSSNRNITDFTPLTALTGLEELSLSRNRIKDLTLLSGLTGLTRLVIYGNEITDLTPLEKLTGLTQLDLSYNEITNLTPLEKLTGLTQVKLSGNEITDLTPLANLTGLEELVLGSIQVVDINGLSSLTNLKNLELWDNEITDLTPLANLTGLTQLKLSDNKITDLTPLANLTGLTKLELNSNQVVDITPLANLTGLTKLELKDNPIQDVTPLYILRDRNPNLRIEMPLPEPDLIPDANLAEAVREAQGMVLIPAGEFQMGSNDAADDEQPVHTVYVDTFYMDKTEVTNAQYKAFLIANPYWQKSHVVARFHSGYYPQQASYREDYDFQQVSEPPLPDVDYLHDWNGVNYPTGKGNHPVTFVNWYAAMAYAEWAVKRLPTEAEWEYAARGGLVGKKYPHGDTITTRDANYNAPASWEDKYTTEVGSYPANAYGLYDMAGNVWEWCLDEYDSDFYATFPPNGVARNPVAGPNIVVRLMRKLINIKGYRVLRGGSWESALQNIRVAKRIYNPPFSLAGVAGFRCVKDVSP